MRAITLIAGDGIGPEVTCAAREVVQASGAAVAFEEVLAGQRAEREYGTPLPRAVFDAIEKTRLVLKGPTQTPFAGDYRVAIERAEPAGRPTTRSYPSIAIALRRELNLILSVVMLLRYICKAAAADRVEAALTQVLREKRALTRDIGGDAGTRAMTEAIVGKLTA